MNVGRCVIVHHLPSLLSFSKLFHASYSYVDFFIKKCNWFELRKFRGWKKYNTPIQSRKTQLSYLEANKVIIKMSFSLLHHHLFIQRILRLCSYHSPQYLCQMLPLQPRHRRHSSPLLNIINSTRVWSSLATLALHQAQQNILIEAAWSNNMPKVTELLTCHFLSLSIRTLFRLLSSTHLLVYLAVHGILRTLRYAHIRKHQFHVFNF